MPRLERRVLAALGFSLLTGSAGAAGPGFDRAARTEDVRRAELAFATSVLENRPEAFAAMVDENAAFVGGGGVTRGKAQIVEEWKGFFGDARPHFEWHPEVVELSGDGEVGLTRGPWTIRAKNKDGKEIEQKGTFNSVWRRQADGSWRVVFDAGCGPCPACGG